jgi:hypothetical protein
MLILFLFAIPLETFDFLINNTQFADLDSAQSANFNSNHDKAKNEFESSLDINSSNISSKVKFNIIAYKLCRHSNYLE